MIHIRVMEFNSRDSYQCADRVAAGIIAGIKHLEPQPDRGFSITTISKSSMQFDADFSECLHNSIGAYSKLSNFVFETSRTNSILDVSTLSV
jgi:hypothetical protein